MRWIAMLVLGMAIGGFAAITLVGAMRQETPLRKGLMAVSSQQLRELRAAAADERCDLAAAARRLQLLRALAHDFEPAILPTGRDERFRGHLTEYVSLLERTLAAPPARCTDLAPALRALGAGCKRCHDDFR